MRLFSFVFSDEGWFVLCGSVMVVGFTYTVINAIAKKWRDKTLLSDTINMAVAYLVGTIAFLLISVVFWFFIHSLL